MSDSDILKASLRTKTGSRDARKLRREGRGLEAEPLRTYQRGPR